MEEEWGFARNTEPKTKSKSYLNIREVIVMLRRNINESDGRPLVPLGHGDPSVFPCFRTTPVAEEAIFDAVRSGKYNCYVTGPGLLPTRKAIAEYLSQDLPDDLSPEDVFVTVGCKQAIDIMLQVLAQGKANILLPRPGFPRYEDYCSFCNLEVRHYDLLPEKGWEVDLHSLEKLADKNTAAVVLINPGNPCGNVFTYEHLKKIAETARKLRILVISDEAYAHLCFGDKPFVPMAVLGSIVPVVTLGSISKRWVVPGWRFGWIAISDTHGILQNSGIIDRIHTYMDSSPEPPTFIQGAIPQILQKTTNDFFSNLISLLKETSDTCFNKVKEISCFTCPHKPEGSMFVMVKLELSLLEDVTDDMDFCLKLGREESVIVLPGIVVGLKNWLRITFAIDASLLQEGLSRIGAFCKRHAKKKQGCVCLK